MKGGRAFPQLDQSRHDEPEELSWTSWAVYPATRFAVAYIQWDPYEEKSDSLRSKAVLGRYATLRSIGPIATMRKDARKTQALLSMTRIATAYQQ